jgi:hypothetical protein
VHFNVPIALGDPNRAAKEEAWVASIGQTIRPFGDDVVKRAADKILNTWTGTDRRFPLPGTIRKICDDIAAEDKRRELPLDGDNSTQPGSWHRKRLALELIRGPMGRRAAAEGWVTALYGWIVEHGRMPSETAKASLKTIERTIDGDLAWPTVTRTEVDHCRVQAQEADRAYAHCLRGGWAFARSMAQIGEKIAVHREVLADHVSGRIDLLAGMRVDHEIDRRIKGRQSDRDRLAAEAKREVG